ncbi:glucose-6-phosphate dehydrogenase, partial [Candidatus Woesearchaeota archaeon]|nr:glucose-6-phosphate dehydrogenase [Candidatus Woesearchaeota archaeon]
MKGHYCILSIFGATGDLTNRKLLPALYFLEQERYLKENFRIIAIARKEKTDEQYREEAIELIKSFSKRKINDDVAKKLASRINYLRLEFSDSNGYLNLKNLMEELSGEKCYKCERIFFLAVPSSSINAIVANLKKAKLAEKESKGRPYNRVMFEKPFGHDLKSARELNAAVTKVFDEKQIYRIDHYMAKELVQNLIVLRFANSIFEPLWNKEYIDHVQINVAEALGMEGRGEYY